MNKQTILGAVTLLVVILGIVVFAALKPASVKAPVSAVATSTTPSPTQTASRALPSFDASFPVPPLYAKNTWSAAKEVAGVEYAADMRSGTGASFVISHIHPSGILYSATKTNPNVLVWQKAVDATSADEPSPYYGGDPDLLTYYETQLTALGYREEILYLDKNQNVAADTWGDHTYAVQALDADGPKGTIRGYIQGVGMKFRVILIKSYADKDEVFVSDILDTKDEVSQLKAM